MSYSSVVLADNPLLYWRLGESVGTVAEDATANNRDGTYSATGVTYSATGTLVADANTAVTFDGTAGNVRTASSVSPGTQIVTFECWANFPVFNTTDDLLAEFSPNYNSNAGSFLCDPCTGAGLWAVGANGTGVAARTFTRPSTGAPHHCVFVYDLSNTATRFVVYIDNVVQTLTGTGNAGINTFGNHNLFVGSRNAASLFLNVTVDEVALYAGELPASKVQTHYMTGLNTLSLVLQSARPTRYLL